MVGNRLEIISTLGAVKCFGMNLQPQESHFRGERKHRRIQRKKGYLEEVRKEEALVSRAQKAD